MVYCITLGFSYARLTCNNNDCQQTRMDGECTHNAKILPIKKPPHLMKRLPGSKFLGLYQQLPNSIQIITKTTIVPKQPPPSFFAP